MRRSSFTSATSFVSPSTRRRSISSRRSATRLSFAPGAPVHGATFAPWESCSPASHPTASSVSTETTPSISTGFRNPAEKEGGGLGAQARATGQPCPAYQPKRAEKAFGLVRSLERKNGQVRLGHTRLSHSPTACKPTAFTVLFVFDDIPREWYRRFEPTNPEPRNAESRRPAHFRRIGQLGPSRAALFPFE